MRLRFLITVMGVAALLLAGCSLVDIPTPARSEGSSSAPAVSEQPAIVALTATHANSADAAIQDNSLPTAATEESAQQPTVTVVAPSPTPAPVLRQLTSGGCCVQPAWSVDGGQVLYIDRPSDQAPAGLWGVAVQGGERQLVSERLGIYSPDMQLRAALVNGSTVVERVASGEQWTIPNEGRAVSFSADGNWLAWTAGQSDPPFDTAQRQVWVSQFDGSQARQVFSSVGGGFAGWSPDGRLLVSGRVEGADTEQAYWALSLDPSQEGEPIPVELARGERLRDAQFSRDGSWLAYMVTFSQDPSQDGLWLADTHNGERHKLDVFGSYQWRDAGRLLVIPLDLSQPMHRVLQVQAATGEVQALTDPAVTPFKIANGDWSVSPDGSKLVFNSAQDGNIWVLELPEP